MKTPQMFKGNNSITQSYLIVTLFAEPIHKMAQERACMAQTTAR